MSDRIRAARWAKVSRSAAVLAAGIGLAACSAVPDAVNPVAWYHGVEGWFESDEDQQARDQAKTAEQTTPPLPGAGRDYPNLSTVPERPRGVSSPAERNRVSQGLAADRENARYAEPEPNRQPAADLGAPAAAPRTPVTRQTVPPRAAPSPDGLERLPLEDSPSPPPVPRSSLEERDPSAAAQQQSTAPPPSMSQPSPSSQAAQPAPAPRPAPLPGVQQASFQSTAAPAAALAQPAPAADPARATAPAAADGGTTVDRSYQAALAQSEPAASAGRDAAAPGAYVVYFGSGSAQLDAADRGLLRDVARLHKAEGGAVRVVGHASSRTRQTDPLNQRLVNFRLSSQRAEAVARELARLGVPRDAMTVAAVSDSAPVYQESMPTGEAGNRRVEIFLER